MVIELFHGRILISYIYVVLTWFWRNRGGCFPVHCESTQFHRGFIENSTNLPIWPPSRHLSLCQRWGSSSVDLKPVELIIKYYSWWTFNLDLSTFNSSYMNVILSETHNISEHAMTLISKSKVKASLLKAITMVCIQYASGLKVNWLCHNKAI